MNSYTQDDKGNKSSLRFILAYLFALIGLMVVVWVGAFISESFKPEPDYSGLAQIIGAIMGGGVVSLIAKVIQKKFENNKSIKNETQDNLNQQDFQQQEQDTE
jgi:positive regulator of sigma E activity